MTRDALTASMRSESTGDVITAGYLLDVEFPSGTVSTCTFESDVTWSGTTYTSNGLLVSIEGVNERPEGSIQQLELGMYNSSSLETKIQTDNYHFSRVYVYLAFVDGDYAVIADPLQFSFYLSSIIISQGGDSNIASLNCEPVYNLDGNSVVYPSTLDQELRYSGDTFFDDVPNIAGKEIAWGQQESIIMGGDGGGSTLPTIRTPGTLPSEK